MARMIGDECITCGACETTCPMDAISMGEIHFEVDEELCIDCGVCEIGCPAHDISEKE